MAYDNLAGGMYETFNLPVFLLGVLAAAGLLLILPIGFLFHPTILIYAAVGGTAVYFAVVLLLVLKPKAD